MRGLYLIGAVGIWLYAIALVALTVAISSACPHDPLVKGHGRYCYPAHWQNYTGWHRKADPLLEELKRNKEI